MRSRTKVQGKTKWILIFKSVFLKDLLEAASVAMFTKEDVISNMTPSNVSIRIGVFSKNANS